MSVKRLKERLRTLGELKPVTELPAGSLGERVELALRHSEALLEAFPPPAECADDELEVWLRVHAHLASVSEAG